MKSLTQFAFLIVCALACFAIVWGVVAYPRGYEAGMRHAGEMIEGRFNQLDMRSRETQQKLRRLSDAQTNTAAAIMLLNHELGDPLGRSPGGEATVDQETGKPTFPESNDPENCR